MVLGIMALGMVVHMSMVLLIVVPGLKVFGLVVHLIMDIGIMVFG